MLNMESEADRDPISGSQAEEYSTEETPRCDPFVDMGRFESSNDDLEGYELVADLLRRQDEALGELDRLNQRIETAIDAITASRNEAESGDQEPLPLPADQPAQDDSQDVRRAA